MMMLAVMVMKGRGRGTSPLARRVDRSLSSSRRKRAFRGRTNMRVAKETARLAAYAHAMQAVLEVADGGGRPSTLAKGPAADVFASLRGVYRGMILGGDGLVCRLAVLRLLGTSLGWLLAGLELTDGHLRGQAGCDSHGARGCRRRARGPHLDEHDV